MKKLLIFVLLILILLCSTSGMAFADTPEVNFDTINNATKNINSSQGSTSILFDIVVNVAKAINVLITGELAYVSGYKSISEMPDVNLQTICFNKLEAFNIDYTRTSADIPQMLVTLRQSVISWFNVLRNMSIGFMIITLVYTGIKMAISTGQKESNYKKMLQDWLTAFVLLLVVQYIIMGLIKFSAFLVEKIPIGNIDNFQSQIMEELTGNIANTSGPTLVMAAIMYCGIVYYTYKFVAKYALRQIRVGFLIVIAPLTLAIYPIDKLNNRQVSFEVWIKTLFSDVFIQLVDCILVFIFLFSASNILQQYPILLFPYYFGISKGEDFIKNLLGVEWEQE